MANPLNPFWQGPMRPVDADQEAFLRSREGFMGHPTAPGPRDENFVRRGNPAGTRDGVPGIPRLYSGPHHGPGIPGTSPAGPMQPGVKDPFSDDQGGF